MPGRYAGQHLAHLRTQHVPEGAGTSEQEHRRTQQALGGGGGFSKILGNACKLRWFEPSSLRTLVVWL